MALWLRLSLEVFVDQVFGSRERVLFFLFPTGMGSKARGVSFVAKVSDGKVMSYVPEKDFGLKMTVMNHSRSHAGADQDNIVPFV